MRFSEIQPEPAPCTTKLLAQWIRGKIERREAQIKAAILKQTGGVMPTAGEVNERAFAKISPSARELYWDGKLILTETPEGEFIEP